MTRRIRLERRREWLVAGLAMVVCASVLAIAFTAAGPDATGRISASTPATTPAARISLGSFYLNSEMTFATLHGRDGVTLQMTVNCGTQPSLDVGYAQTRAGTTLSQDYSGRPRTCRFTRDLDSARFAAHWGRRLALRLTARLDGAPVVLRDRAGAGCYATSTTRTYRVRGSLLADIHPAVYGRFIARQLRLTVETTVIPQCAMQSSGDGAYQGEFVFIGPRHHERPRTVERITGDELTGFRGNTQLDATQGTGYVGIVDLTASVADHPAPGVSDNLSLRLRPGAFSARTSNLRTARIDGSSPFSSGSMIYRSGTGCSASADATQGALHGEIRIDEPGAVRLTVTGHDVGRTELDGPHVRSQDCRVLTG